MQQLTFTMYIGTRYRPRFFNQVGHQTTSAYIENKHFSLNHVIIRPTKIMNNLLKVCKICIFKLILWYQKSTKSFFSEKNI